MVIELKFYFRTFSNLAPWTIVIYNTLKTNWEIQPLGEATGHSWLPKPLFHKFWHIFQSFSSVSLLRYQFHFTAKISRKPLTYFCLKISQILWVEVFFFPFSFGVSEEKEKNLILTFFQELLLSFPFEISISFQCQNIKEAFNLFVFENLSNTLSGNIFPSLFPLALARIFYLKM